MQGSSVVFISSASRGW